MASSSSAIDWLQAPRAQMAAHQAAQAKRKAEEAAEKEEADQDVTVAVEKPVVAVQAAGTRSFLDVGPEPTAGEPEMAFWGCGAQKPVGFIQPVGSTSSSSSRTGDRGGSRSGDTSRG